MISPQTAPSAPPMATGKVSSIASRDALNELDDRRIAGIKPLIPPQILMEDLPLSVSAAKTVSAGREAAGKILAGNDDRLLVVVGPCSIHDSKAAKEYAARLSEYAKDAESDLCLVMRVYFEKPRTTIGWKGAINDPFLDNSFQINKGLRLARDLLLHINELGIPAGCEFLDTITPQFIGDLVAWGAIGARTTESQVHRELASGLSVPVGFKNGTDGNVGIAIDAIRSASTSHHFLSVTKQGLSAIVATAGNECCHLILRGGAAGPNYSSSHIENYVAQLAKAGVCDRVMVDCSHGNSQKKHQNQILVARDIVSQLSSPNSTTANKIFGVMIESHLFEGAQKLPLCGIKSLSELKYGVSVTDACLSFEDTVATLNELRQGVQQRRALNAKVNDFGAIEESCVVDEF